MFRRALLILALSGAAAACTAPPESSRGLDLRLPARLSQGLASTDAALCDALEVFLTFDRTDDLASPPLDQVELLPKADVDCTWVLGAEAKLESGTYDLVVRFVTQDAPGSCAAPLKVGAFVRRGLSFPFPASFTGLADADFVSRPGEESRLGDPGLSFDPDNDGRDSLAELAQGSDPCRQSSVPVPTLTVSSATVTETSTVMITLRSIDADDVPHHYALAIAHANGPTVGTETIVLSGTTDGRGPQTLTPRGPGEQWSLRAEADTNALGGAVELTLHFVPDEPFIGALRLELVADDGQGNVLGRSEIRTITVQNVDDPTRLLFGDEGLEQSALRYTEQASPADAYRFRFDDPDLGADVGTWTPIIAAGPPGLSVARDGAFWVLRWSPSNADVIASSAQAGLDLRFNDGSGAARGQSHIGLEISPLWNDPPSFEPPAVGDLALPAGPFLEHRVPFVVIDPDESPVAPTCNLSIAPAAGTTCTTPFSSARCEPTGLRAGDRWPFALILVPSPTYAADCGRTPGFLASFTLTDVAPMGARNGPLMTGTGGTPLELRTASVVSAAIVSGGPGAVAGATDPSPPLIHGTTGRALVQVIDGGGTRVSTIIDLNGTSPSFIHRFPASELCSLNENLRAKDIYAADEVNGRIAVITRGFSGGSCSVNGLNVVTMNPPSTVFHSSAEICGQAFNDLQGSPVVDAAGNFYIPCNTTPGRVARIAPNGAVSFKTFALYDAPSSPDFNRRVGLVTDPGGVPWLIWPDVSGLLLVNLGTFDLPSPTTERIAQPSRWEFDDLDDVLVDPYRSSFLLAYNRRNTTAQLLRVRFDAGGRTLDQPIELGNIGGSTSNSFSYMRLALRDAGPGSVDPGTDLVVQPGSSSDPRPHIDLDAWAITVVRPVTDYFVGGGSAGLFASPDKRYYVIPSTMNFEDGSRGMYLYRYDPAIPREFITLPVPSGGADWAGRTEVSEKGNVLVISEQDGAGAISVVHFVEAAAGRD